jgi:hypothetical protein
MLNDESVLVRPDAALRQMEADEAAKREFNDQGGRIFTPPGVQPPLGGDNLGGDGVKTLSTDAASISATASEATLQKLPRRFCGVVELDPTRLNKQVPEVVEHVVEHLTKLTGAKVRVKLEIDADVADGVPSKTVMDVTENARTLKFSDFGFEEE